jgi:hypothetical protein
LTINDNFLNSNCSLQINIQFFLTSKLHRTLYCYRLFIKTALKQTVVADSVPLFYKVCKIKMYKLLRTWLMSLENVQFVKQTNDRTCPAIKKLLRFPNAWEQIFRQTVSVVDITRHPSSIQQSQLLKPPLATPISRDRKTIMASCNDIRFISGRKQLTPTDFSSSSRQNWAIVLVVYRK